MAVSVIRFLPYHVMRRLTFHCVAQQKPHNAFFPCFSPWCGHPGTASLARQSAAKSGRFSPDGKTGHGTSGAADERHPGPPQAASPANSPSTRFTAQPASEGAIAHHSIQCSATAPVSSSTFAVDDTPSVWISREPSTTCSAPLARGWPCMRSWNHEHLHYLQRRVPDMGERDGVDRRRRLPLPHRCRVQPGAHRLPATADLQRAGTVQNRDGRRQEPGLDRQCGDTVRTNIGPRYEVGGIHRRPRAADRATRLERRLIMNWMVTSSIHGGTQYAPATRERYTAAWHRCAIRRRR